MSKHSKKTNRKNKKPRITTAVVLLALALAVLMVLINLLGILGQNVSAYQDSTGSTAEMTQEQKSLQEERESEKEQLSAKRQVYSEDTGAVSYSAYGSQSLTGAGASVTDAYEAEDALESMAAGLFSTAQEDTGFDCVYEDKYADATMYTLQRYYSGVPVYGDMLRLEAGNDGQILSVGGTCREIGDDALSVDTRFDGWDCEEKAKSYINQTYGASGEFAGAVENCGKYIFYIEGTDTPSVGYRFDVRLSWDSSPIARVFVDGITGEVVQDISLVRTAAVETDLYGQDYNGKEKKQTLTVWENYDETVELRDEERRFSTYEDVDEELNATLIRMEKSDKNHKSAVDALANLERCYDYFQAVFGLDGAADDSSVTCKIYTDLPGGYLTDNAGMYGNDTVLIGPASDGKNELSSYLDIMGHEFAHGVFYTKTHSETMESYEIEAINEGIGDLFGNFVEDYSDDKQLNNTGNWKTEDGTGYQRSAVSLDQNSDSAMIGDAKEFQQGVTDCHNGAYIVSHPACRMINEGGIDSQTAGYLYYNAVCRMNNQDNYKTFRQKLEQAALTGKSSGGLTASAESTYLSDAGQIEALLDALDEVGVENSYDYSLSKNAVVTVYDKNNEPLKDCTLTIEKYYPNADGTYEAVVSGEAIPESGYALNLSANVYRLHVYDADGSELTSCSFLANDNADDSQVEEYKDSVKIFTDKDEVRQHIAFAIDVSGSMEGEPMTAAKAAASRFVDSILDATSYVDISIVTFADDASVVCEATNDRDALHSAIDGIYSSGGTNMLAGLETAYQTLPSDKTENTACALVVMGDGLPNVVNGTEPDSEEGYRQGVVSEASTIKADNTTIFAFGYFHNSYGDDLTNGQALIRDIASPGYSYNAADTEDISGILEFIAFQTTHTGGTVRIEVACPVNVTVSYGGEVLSSDPALGSTSTSFGILTYEEEEEEETNTHRHQEEEEETDSGEYDISRDSGLKKILNLKEGPAYEISFTGYDEGTMDYSVSYADENGNYTDVRQLENVQVSDGARGTISAVRKGGTMLQMDLDGDGIFDKIYSSGFTAGSGHFTFWKIVILIVVLAFAARYIYRLIRYYIHRRQLRGRNKYICWNCGGERMPKDKFCPNCGAPVRMPAAVEKQDERPESRPLMITKLVIAGILFLEAGLLWAVYCSPATEVYRQLCGNRITAAQHIYEEKVEGKTLSENYLRLILKTYMEKVEDAEENKTADTASVQGFYECVADMNLGSLSERANAHLPQAGTD